MQHQVSPLAPLRQSVYLEAVAECDHEKQIFRLETCVGFASETLGVGLKENKENSNRQASLTERNI